MVGEKLKKVKQVFRSQLEIKCTPLPNPLDYYPKNYRLISNNRKRVCTIVRLKLINK